MRKPALTDKETDQFNRMFSNYSIYQLTYIKTLIDTSIVMKQCLGEK